MAIQKVPARAIESSASSANLNIDAGTLYLDATNNRVGVSTTSPNYKLHTYGTDGTAYAATGSTARTPSGTLVTAQTANATVGVSATIDMISNGQHAWIGAVDNASGYTPSMVFGQSTGASAWTERMRIDSSGNVGIGTDSPAYKLQVRRAGGVASLGINLDNTVGFTRDVQYYSVADSTTDTTGHAFYVRNGSATNNLALRINNTGTLTLQGGSTSATGVGITFPASQSASSDANTLDDYEEGTWTPTAFGSSTSGSTSYSAQVGFYTKIGRQVTVSFYVAWSALTGTGALKLGGLPYNVINVSNINMVGSVMTDQLNWTAGTSICLYCNQDSNYLSIYGSTDDSGWAMQQCVNETVGIIGTITYFSNT